MKSRAMAVLFLCASTAAFAGFPPQIKHVLVIFQENRTPDNFFHYLTPACPIPANATGLKACTPAPVTTSCYNISPCGISNRSGEPLPVPLQPIPLSGGQDPDHSHNGFVNMCDPDPVTFVCRNDGAWRTADPPGYSYAYVENAPVTNSDGSQGHTLDPYLTLAEDYGWANYMYQTNQGSSYPAHLFMFSGTSALTADDDANSIFLAENFGGDVTNEHSGCLAPANGVNELVSPALGAPPPYCTKYAEESVQECLVTNSALVYPTNPVGTFCATHESMADILDARSISWKYYAANPGWIWAAPDSAKNVCEPAFVNPNGDPSSALECTGKDWNTSVDVQNLGTDILRDIASCNLSTVNWVIPDGAWSDHSGFVNLYGPSWAATVVNAIGNNPKCAAGTPDAGQTYWDDTAIVITWDDWGGWSDHEPPPIASKLPCKSTDCPGDYLYGFRVPLIVVSAYTPAGYINNIPHDFGTVLRFIEGVNHVPEGALGFADKRAKTDLSNFFSLAKPRPFKTIPSQKDASYFLSQKGRPAIAPDND